MSARKDRDQIIPTRRIEAALSGDRREVVPAIRELIEEAYKRGMSAGQMKERLSGRRPEPLKGRTW